MYKTFNFENGVHNNMEDRRGGELGRGFRGTEPPTFWGSQSAGVFISQLPSLLEISVENTNTSILFLVNCEVQTDVYDVSTDSWSDGPYLNYPVFTPPCLIDLGSSENLIVSYTRKGLFIDQMGQPSKLIYISP